MATRGSTPKALAVMNAVAKDLALEMPGKVIEDPYAVEGILAFGASSLKLRMLLKTTPGAQWEVAAVYRLRLKEAFDRAGVSIALPQLDVHLPKAFESVPNKMA